MLLNTVFPFLTWNLNKPPIKAAWKQHLEHIHSSHVGFTVSCYIVLKSSGLGTWDKFYIYEHTHDIQKTSYKQMWRIWTNQYAKSYDSYILSNFSSKFPLSAKGISISHHQVLEFWKFSLTSCHFPNATDRNLCIFFTLWTNLCFFSMASNLMPACWASLQGHTHNHNPFWTPSFFLLSIFQATLTTFRSLPSPFKS